MLLQEASLRSVDLDFVKLEFYEPDVVTFLYQSNVHLTWPMLQQVARATNELTGYKKCYMVSVIGEGLTIEREARDNGTKTETQAYTKAAAIVQNSLAHRIIGNFIVKVQRPEAPTKLFNKMEDALIWIKKLKVQEQ